MSQGHLSTSGAYSLSDEVIGFGIKEPRPNRPLTRLVGLCRVRLTTDSTRWGTLRQDVTLKHIDYLEIPLDGQLRAGVNAYVATTVQ